jgi:squalene-associated FAD-dependent desaturase
MKVVVVGGGLAGIVAALDCVDAGAQVTLLEVRPRLGGAVYSFERDGLALDNGQHVFLRCYHAYLALLARLGSDCHVHLQPRFEIPLLSPDGKLTVLRRARFLPAPLHLAGALLGYSRLSRGERLRAALAARALGRLDPTDPALDARSLGEWLAEHSQSAHAIAVLWDLIALPALNLPAGEASLALGAFVFRTGLLARADAGDMGFHLRPLSEIVGDPALHTLRQAGAEVRLGWRAERIARAGGLAGGPADGLQVHGAGVLHADAVILAVPHDRAPALLDELAPAIAQRLRGLGSSPIVNLHVLYDRPVCQLPFVGGVNSPIQYVFDRGRAAGLEPGRHLAVSLSGAMHDMERTEALRERYLPALAELFPRARAAHVERFLVTREHAATFRAAPGVHKLRPGSRTPVPGLVLAGAYTDTGWPATLEGAVLSGHAAARIALGAEA